jgi:hypothetical protein
MTALAFNSCRQTSVRIFCNNLCQKDMHIQQSSVKIDITTAAFRLATLPSASLIYFETVLMI